MKVNEAGVPVLLAAGVRKSMDGLGCCGGTDRRLYGSLQEVVM